MSEGKMFAPAYGRLLDDFEVGEVYHHPWEVTIDDGMLGLWAAEKLGMTGDAAEAYAKEVVASDFEEAGDHDVFRKVRADFDAKGVAQSDHQIRRTMDELMAAAIQQIKKT